MIEEVNMFKTPDGKLHETEEKAMEHILDKARELLDKRLSSLTMKRMLTRSEQYQLIMTLFPDYRALMNLYVDLSKILGE